MKLSQLVEELNAYPGLKRKSVVGPWASRFASGCGPAEPGDDASAVEFEGGFLLVTSECLRPSLFQDPHFAGRCAVTVSVNDIYAMGGRPLGVLLSVFSGWFDDKKREAFLEGVAEGLDRYQIPMLGGHTSPEGEGPYASVTGAGFARSLLVGDGAGSGDVLIVALELEGVARERLMAWDTLGRPGDSTVLDRLEALPDLAEGGAVTACRDISEPGLLGTLAMMLEASGVGATVDLDAVPRPESVDLSWWLRAHPSFGFVLSCPPERSAETRSVFERHGVTAAVIGDVTQGSAIDVLMGGEKALYLDWREDPVVFRKGA